MDAVCQGSADGVSCNDTNACTEGDACQGGMCVPGVEPCRVELPCGAQGGQGCSIDVVCTQACQVTVAVTVRARPRARCRVVLTEIRIQTNGLVTQAKGAKKARRISNVAKGEIDESGALVLNVKLNKIGRKLLRNVPIGGELPAQADITIRDSKTDGGGTRLLPRLIKLVRG